jgi:hypothetical protein
MKRLLPYLPCVFLVMFLPARADAQLLATYCSNPACHAQPGAGGPAISAAVGYSRGGWTSLVNIMNGYLPVTSPPADVQPKLTSTQVSQIAAFLDQTYPLLTITGPGSLAAGTIGTSYSSVQFTASSACTSSCSLTWSQSGLPSGMNLSAAGLLTGTPGAGTSGPHSVNFTVTDAIGDSVSVSLSLTINAPPPSITGPASLPAGTVGAAYGPVTFTATGGTGTFSWSATGLPNGLSINSSTGVLSGTPSAGSQGAYNPQFTVTSGSTANVTKSLTINPAATPLSITGPGSLSPGTVGVTYGSVSFSATGGSGGYTWTASGLPVGLAINLNTGLLSGVPAAGSQGSYNPQFIVKDSSNNTALTALTLVISAASVNLSITGPGSLSPGTVGVTYGSVSFSATGGSGGYTWTATGLPNGLTINLNTGVLSGVPAAGSQGSYNPQFVVKDSSNNTALATLTLTINATSTSLSIVGPGSLSTGTVGAAYGPVTFSATGGSGGYTWTATGLPNGLTINLNTGVLSGIPAAGTQGPYNPQFIVKDSSNATATVLLSLTITAQGQSPAPWVGTLVPNPLPALNGNQTLTINGLGFQAGSGLKVRVTSGGSTSDLAAPQVNFLSTNQLTVLINVGVAVANWTAQVINPDGQSSNTVSFSVTTQPVNTSIAMPQLAFGGGWYTALYFSNTGGTVVSFTVNFIDDNGAALTVPLVGIGDVTSRTVTLNPGSIAILEAPDTGSLTQGWAQATLPPGVSGYAVFRQSVRGKADQEAVVPLASGSDTTAELIYDNVNLTTSVAVLNPNNQQAVITMILYGSDGSQIGSGQLVVAAHSKKAANLTDLPGMAAAAGKRGWVIFSVNSGAVSITGLRSGGLAFTSIPDTYSSGTTATSITVPQIAFGGGWYTALYFSNTSSSPVSFQLNFISDTGTPLDVPLTGIGPVSSWTVDLNPRSTATLEAANAGNLAEGWAEASLPPGVTGYAVFRQSVPGRADQEAVVLLTPESSQTADLVYDNVNFTTAIAVLNPTFQQVTLTIVLYGTDGSQLGTGQLVLAPRSKQAAKLTDLPGLEGAAGKRGRATFLAPNGALSVIGLRAGNQAFTSIPDTHR